MTTVKPTEHVKPSAEDADWAIAFCEKPDDDQDLTLHVRFVEKTDYDDGLKFIGRGARCTISWNENPHWKLPPKPDIRKFQRLVHAIKKDCGLIAQHDEDEPGDIEVNMDAQRRRITLWSRNIDVGLLSAYVSSSINLWRKGRLHAPPTVSPEMHKRMVKHGVKLREDGLFGYRLLCNRKECDEEVGTCYATLTPGSAIEDKLERRSRYTHSTACSILDGYHDDLIYDLVSDGRFTYLDPFVVSDPRGDMQSVDFERMQRDAPKDFARLVEEVEGTVDYDGWCEDAGEVSCET